MLIILYMFEVLKDISVIIFLWVAIISAISLSVKGCKAIDSYEKTVEKFEKSFEEAEIKEY